MRKLFKFVFLAAVFVVARAAYGQDELHVYDSPSFTQKDYSEPMYPHALFVLETSILAASAIENCRNYAGGEYYDMAGIEHRNSGAKCSAVWAPVAGGAFALGWKLHSSPRKKMRVLGHGVMWGTIGAIAANYFLRAER